MVQHASWQSPVLNAFHTPADVERESFTDGIRTELSAPIQTAFPFASLVFSLNYAAPKDSFILLEAQVLEEGKWSDFFKLGLFSQGIKKSFPSQDSAFGRVETDELALARPAQAYRYRIQFCGEAKLTLLAASAVRSPFEYEENKAARLPAGHFQKEIAPISQMELNHPDRRRVCSPVSLCMALNALGVACSAEEVMQGVYDASANIYGNWVFNTAYAGSCGVQAYVRRFGALSELKDFVTPDSLVLASIAYERGELTGAAMERTSGHLVVVRGWENGAVCVADPAALKKQAVLRAYNAREFANAWLRHKRGAAYIVRKK